MDAQPMPTHYETGMPMGPGIQESPYQAIKTAMNLNMNVFKEPRGVMRIIQFIVSIFAFASITGFESYVKVTLVPSCEDPRNLKIDYGYPFRMDQIERPVNCSGVPQTIRLIGDFSSDAQFFVATGVLSFLYCIGISVFYLLFDNLYQANATFPLADFILSVTLGVFWLSGSAAWANGLTGLKNTTGALFTSSRCHPPGSPPICFQTVVGSFTRLNISVVFGFLNFFLWASDLWFLYKETPWFKLKQGSADPDTAAA